MLSRRSSHHELANPLYQKHTDSHPTPLFFAMLQLKDTIHEKLNTKPLKLLFPAFFPPLFRSVKNRTRFKGGGYRANFHHSKFLVIDWLVRSNFYWLCTRLNSCLAWFKHETYFITSSSGISFKQISNSTYSVMIQHTAFNIWMTYNGYTPTSFG